MCWSGNTDSLPPLLTGLTASQQEPSPLPAETNVKHQSGTRFARGCRLVYSHSGGEGGGTCSVGLVIKMGHMTLEWTHYGRMLYLLPPPSPPRRGGDGATNTQESSQAACACAHTHFYVTWREQLVAFNMRRRSFQRLIESSWQLFSLGWKFCSNDLALITKSGQKSETAEGNLFSLQTKLQNAEKCFKCLFSFRVHVRISVWNL